jgi:putative N6-adenine-specific DNA methylase
MCGSGTFTLEAALISSRTPPGFYRDFAFMRWPAFKTRQWQYLKKSLAKEIIPLKAPAIFASDKDSGVCAALSSAVQQHDLSRAVSVIEGDFFDLDPGHFSKKPGVAAFNPPYGVRLGSASQAGKLTAEIAAKLSQDYQKWRVAVFLADRRLAAHFPSGLRRHRVTHGGLNLTLLTGLID